MVRASQSRDGGFARCPHRWPPSPHAARHGHARPVRRRFTFADHVMQVSCSSSVRSTKYLWVMGFPPVNPTIGHPPVPIKTFAAAHYTCLMVPGLWFAKRAQYSGRQGYGKHQQRLCRPVCCRRLAVPLGTQPPTRALTIAWSLVVVTGQPPHLIPQRRHLRRLCPLYRH